MRGVLIKDAAEPAQTRLSRSSLLWREGGIFGSKRSLELLVVLQDSSLVSRPLLRGLVSDSDCVDFGCLIEISQDYNDRL